MADTSPAEPEPGHDLDDFGLEILTVDDCLGLLGTATIGRVAFIDHGAPTILPVNLTLWDGHVVFRTAPGSKLAAALMSQPVALEIDGFDVSAHTGWSVLVKGTISTISEGREIDSLDRLGAMPWSRPDLRHTWVKIRPTEITGRRLSTAT